ncbi:MAG: rhodanese-related sulfurtransferase, partial [Chloroflexi bacterium]|nr:rhodanese-related sulfurtransferase [Chloroflexota bacterium]
YKFVPLPDYESLRAPLLLCCESAPVRGSILLATEGINATIAGAGSAVEAVLAHLRADPRFANLAVRDAWHDSIPFRRMKVRLKKEIVALKAPAADPRRQVGEYIEPEDWNALIGQDDVLVIDARNHYEVQLGSFRGARDPGTEAFSELPRYLDETLDAERHKRVALFCTGGIRCEKATALLLARGFDQVYHLRGGILRYLERVPSAESLWQGECFVFDERGALSHVDVPTDRQT